MERDAARVHARPIHEICYCQHLGGAELHLEKPHGRLQGGKTNGLSDDECPCSRPHERHGIVRKKSFTGSAPGGPSRWSTKRSSEWMPVKPENVVEVSYDHFTGGRFRHGTSVVKWRKDKRPDQCTMDQLEQKISRTLVRNILACAAEEPHDRRRAAVGSKTYSRVDARLQRQLKTAKIESRPTLGHRRATLPVIHFVSIMKESPIRPIHSAMLSHCFLQTLAKRLCGIRLHYEYRAQLHGFRFHSAVTRRED